MQLEAEKLEELKEIFASEPPESII